MNSDAPILAVTPGEPAGVGPECAIRLADLQPELRLLLVADPDLMRQTARRLGSAVQIRTWESGDPVLAGCPACLPVPLAVPAEPGHPDPANAAYVLDCLRAAVGLLRGGPAAALVTGPVHKGVINESGVPFSGHTELLAELAGVSRVVMMLAAGNLRVALVTTHLPLRAVPDAVVCPVVAETIRITARELRSKFGIPQPALQVLGLNPHAGEGGHLGTEELEHITPAIEECRTEGLDVTGPVPADTAFTPGALAACDAVIAMYHDQGLPVLKHAGFGRAVNITLGLPFIRTSVDHGTALDIAGLNQADPGSMQAAAAMAMAMCRSHPPPGPGRRP